MPEKARNIVIVGAGGIVSGSHLPAYKMAGYPVVGIYDLDHEKAEKAAKEFGIPNAVPELEQLIELGVREDAVFDIAVPASKTASILRLLPDNAAVLMQKPMGESIEQAKEILDICHAKNLTAGVNFQLALSQENGDIAIIDVNTSQMVRLFEGFAPDLELKTFSGFGDVKGMVWCTNYEGEY